MPLKTKTNRPCSYNGTFLSFAHVNGLSVFDGLAISCLMRAGEVNKYT
jgi:hypothetical protein